MQRKLRVDGSSLWNDPENQFVLRFNDLNQEKQNKLAKRIKETTWRWKVKEYLREQGEEKLVSLLKEINPVIYAEGKTRRQNQWRQWNIHNIQCLSGWNFRKLDQLIYRFLCLKRPPTHHEINSALTMSIQGINDTESSQAHEIITNQFNLIRNEEPSNLPPPEIGIEEVRSARERTERRNPAQF